MVDFFFSLKNGQKYFNENTRKYFLFTQKLILWQVCWYLTLRIAKQFLNNSFFSSKLFSLPLQPLIYLFIGSTSPLTMSSSVVLHHFENFTWNVGYSRWMCGPQQMSVVGLSIGSRVRNLKFFLLPGENHVIRVPLLHLWNATPTGFGIYKTCAELVH